MGGHGGLNILPQKKWNVYNYDNRDIVQKDKKMHAQKTRKQYQLNRKHTLKNKFDVLRGQVPQSQRQKQQYREIVKKDSILNNQFKRLAEQKKHVNLFENQQKTIENRELLQCQKLKQSEWLKDKNMDYSSKFLGAYNDDSKIPWYAKQKINETKNENKTKNQRYDLQDLIQKNRIQKIKSKQYYKKEYQQIKNFYEGGSRIQNKGAKIQNHEDRQRSRDKKYDFLKNKDRLIDQKMSLSRQSNYNEEREIQNQIQLNYSRKIQTQQQRIQIKNQEQNTKWVQMRVNEQQEQLSQLQKLRLKRLKRQEKQRKRAEQLKRKLMQSIKS